MDLALLEYNLDEHDVRPITAEEEQTPAFQHALRIAQRTAVTSHEISIDTLLSTYLNELGIEIREGVVPHYDDLVLANQLYWAAYIARYLDNCDVASLKFRNYIRQIIWE